MKRCKENLVSLTPTALLMVWFRYLNYLLSFRIIILYRVASVAELRGLDVKLAGLSYQPNLRLLCALVNRTVIET